MISVIDHSVRARLNLTPLAYMLCDACSQLRPLMIGTGVSFLSETLGVNTQSIKQTMTVLIEMGLLEKLVNGYYYPTSKWYLSLTGEQVSIETPSESILKDVIEFFNEVNGTKYHLHSNIDLVKKIIKNNNKLTLEHFKSVIVHKHETWGSDDKMKEYNRPSTLFSGKFLKYLDDANHYWINKQKHDTATTLLGN